MCARRRLDVVREIGERVVEFVPLPILEHRVLWRLPGHRRRDALRVAQHAQGVAAEITVVVVVEEILRRKQEPPTALEVGL